MTALSSPNGVVSNCFKSLDEAVASARNTSTREQTRQHAAVALIMAVTAVEVFFNLWFQTVSESKDPEHQKALLEGLAKRASLEEDEIDQVAEKVPREGAGFCDGGGSGVRQLKLRRNAIVHFTSTHESRAFEHVEIRGLADITDYDALDANTASWARDVAQAGVRGFSVAGISTDQIPHALHQWIGKPPK